MHFLEVTLPRIDEDFSFVVKTEEEMGECHGLTYPDRNEIQIREDAYQRACDESGRYRLTMAHEPFHLIQHTSDNISFARCEGKAKTYMDPLLDRSQIDIKHRCNSMLTFFSIQIQIYSI